MGTPYQKFRIKVLVIALFPLLWLPTRQAGPVYIYIHVPIHHVTLYAFTEAILWFLLTVFGPMPVSNYFRLVMDSFGPDIKGGCLGFWYYLNFIIW